MPLFAEHPVSEELIVPDKVECTLNVPRLALVQSILELIQESEEATLSLQARLHICACHKSVSAQNLVAEEFAVERHRHQGWISGALGL